jgi:acetyl coenzyme A synthetase (ADP forming)-like protein
VVDAGGKQDLVRGVLDRAVAEGRSALSAGEARIVCAAYGIPLPAEGVAASADAAVALAEEMGYPVVAKIVSPDILHKTEAGGVRVGLAGAEELRVAFAAITEAAHAYDKNARIDGVLVQRMLAGGQEVIVGATTDATFGKLVAFGIGGILVEVLRDVTFRLAPITAEEATSMLDGIAAAAVLRGVRGQPGVDREALAALLVAVSRLVTDFPEISEVDLNPVLADERGAVAVDVRFLLGEAPGPSWPTYSGEEILVAMRRMFHPRSVAVIGASSEPGKIGNSVMRNLVNGGFEGEIYPVNPRATEIEGRRCFATVAEIPGDVDVAVFAIPAKLVAQALEEVGRKGVAAAVLIPSGFAETGNVEGQAELQEVARKWGVRFLGPNIYGFYYTPAKLCATFCTPYDVAGPVALSSQSGGIGMAILGFARSAKLGVSAIVGLGNKADVDEDDLLTFFEQDEATRCIAMHMEDLKDGRAFLRAAKRVSRTKPIVVLKAGRTAAGARAAGSHTGALAGDDKVYDDLLRSAGVVRAPGLRDMLEYARCLPMLPTPKGENVVIITGAGGSGVLLSDACTDNGLSLMAMPPDLDVAFRRFIPPFGAAGNPVDITGGEPPATYRNTIALGLEDERIHALVLGYWHTIVTPPMVFAELLIDVVEEKRRAGVDKPVVASLAGDVEVEAACEALFAHGIPSYPYTTETPVVMLGAKYRWARAAGLVAG